MKSILISLLLLLTLGACNKEVFTTDKPIPNVTNLIGNKKIIWQQPLENNLGRHRSVHPKILENGILYSARDYGGGEPFYLRQKEDGNIKWAQENVNSDIASKYAAFLLNNDLIFNTGHYTYSVNTNSGDINWKTHFSFCNPRIFQAHEQIFLPTYNKGFNWDTCQLVAISPVDGSTEEVITVTKTDGYTIDIESLAGWTNPKNESVIIFQKRQINFDILDSKVDLCAYNLDLKQFDWIIEDITPTGESSIHLPIIQDNKVYFTGARTIICVDALTGEVVWEQQLGSSYANCAPLLIENKLFVNGDNHQISRLKPETGEIVWDNPNSGASVNNMVYYQGIIYFGSRGDGKLHAVKASDGMELWAEDSPNEQNYSCVMGGIAIDEERGLLYTEDTRFAMCIEL